jgi:X-Pro dipeptidyl-peptidase
MLLLLGALPGQAQSDTNNAHLRLRAGELTLSSSGSIQFPATSLNGTAQVVSGSASPLLTIIDARGSGAGWNVSLQSGDFSAGMRTISSSSFSYNATGGTVTRIHGQAIGAGGPAETGVSGSLSVSRKSLAAALNSGMGNYTWRPRPASFTLNLAPTTFAGTYTATVTLTLASGP